jgi:hypothetical protein
MSTTRANIQEAIDLYIKAVDNSANRSRGLFVAEKIYESIITNTDSDAYDLNAHDNAAQDIVTKTIQDIHAQFELMKRSKLLDVAVKLAKIEAIDG